MSAKSLEIGQRVTLSNQLSGVLRFLGFVKFSPGRWVGIELDESYGDNDGSFEGVRYFTCEERHGIFVHVSEFIDEPFEQELSTYTHPNVSNSEEKEKTSNVFKPYNSDDVITQDSIDSSNDSLGIIPDNLIMGEEVAELDETSFPEMLYEKCCPEQDAHLLPEQENLNVTEVLYSPEQHDNLNLTKVIDPSEKCNMNLTQAIGSSIEQDDLNNTHVFNRTAEIEIKGAEKESNIDKELLPSPVCIEPKILPQLKSEQSSLHKTEESPKYASTPKHKINYEFIFEDYAQVAQQYLSPVEFVHGEDKTCTSATCKVCANRSPDRNTLNITQTREKELGTHHDYNKTFINPLNTTISKFQGSKRTVGLKNEVDKTQVLNTTYKKIYKLTEMPNTKKKFKNEQQHRMTDSKSTKESKVPRQVDCSPASNIKPIELSKKKFKKSMFSQSKNENKDKLDKQKSLGSKSITSKIITSDKCCKPSLKSPIYDDERFYTRLQHDPKYGTGLIMMERGNVPQKKLVRYNKPQVLKSKKITGVKPTRVQQPTAFKNKSSLIKSDKKPLVSKFKRETGVECIKSKYAIAPKNANINKDSGYADGAAFKNKSVVECVKKPQASISKKKTAEESIKTEPKVADIGFIHQSRHFGPTVFDPQTGQQVDKTANISNLVTKSERKGASKKSKCEELASISKKKTPEESIKTELKVADIGFIQKSKHFGPTVFNPQTGQQVDKKVNISNLVTKSKRKGASKKSKWEELGFIITEKERQELNEQRKVANKKSAKLEEPRIINIKTEQHKGNRPAVEEKQKFSLDKTVNLTKKSTNAKKRSGKIVKVKPTAGDDCQEFTLEEISILGDYFTSKHDKEDALFSSRPEQRVVCVRDEHNYSLVGTVLDDSESSIQEPFMSQTEESPESSIEELLASQTEESESTDDSQESSTGYVSITNLTSDSEDKHFEKPSVLSELFSEQTLEIKSNIADQKTSSTYKNIKLASINEDKALSEPSLLSRYVPKQTELSGSSIKGQETLLHETINLTKLMSHNVEKAFKKSLLPRLSSKQKKESQTSIQGKETSSLNQTINLTISSPNSEMRSLEESRFLFKKHSAAKCESSEDPLPGMHRPEKQFTRKLVIKKKKTGHHGPHETHSKTSSSRHELIGSTGSYRLQNPSMKIKGKYLVKESMTAPKSMPLKLPILPETKMQSFGSKKTREIDLTEKNSRA